MPDEKKSGALSFAAVKVLKTRGLTTHFLAFVTVFCEDESTAQAKIDRYMQWAEKQPLVPLHKKQPSQKQWIAMFQKHPPEL
jgi:hypothetical protein